MKRRPPAEHYESDFASVAAAGGAKRSLFNHTASRYSRLAMNPLWAITTYFNPTGSRRRLANYRAFRASLAAPLLTVEWAPDGRFELADGDADMLVQLNGGNTMWQKERLLNVGIARLPASCHYVAWLDCDIVFDSDAWASEAPRR